MPTLIRLFVFLIVIAGLGFAGMIALTLTVDPGEKDITIKIPARQLAQAQAALNKPLDLNDLPAPVNVVKDSSSASDGGASASASASVPDITPVSAPDSSAEPSIDLTDTGASGPGVKTVDVGGGD